MKMMVKMKMRMMMKMRMRMKMKRMGKKIIRNDIIFDRGKLLCTTRLHWKVSAYIYISRRSCN